MVSIKFPKLDINHIEIFITEIISIQIDLGLLFNIKQTLQYIWFLELTIGQFQISFLVDYKIYPIDHTNRIPLLKLWGLF